jgi:NADPH:quinone reductase-like Zn-dependent oxidoreductase
MAARTPAAGAGGNDAGARGTTMKAIVQHRYGPPGVLALEDIAIPAVGDDEVLIRVRAAGLNAGDGFITRGVPYFMRLFAGLRRPRHGVRGVDVAGTVSAVGANVAGLRPGDEVLGSCGNVTVGGAFAEYARVPRGKVARKPAAITFEQAAAIPVAAVTALQALRDAGRVRPGQQVLINGASGGVGTFAVQIARALGAEVTGVCSTSNAGLVASLGADAVIDYTRDDFTRGPERYDVIVDNVANHRLSDLRRVLTAKGTLASFVPQRIRPFLGRVNQRDLDTITGLIEAGKITPVIDRTYPLSDAPEALGYLGQGHARGKIVITT